jgi:hypothetical protein
MITSRNNIQRPLAKMVVAAMAVMEMVLVGVTVIM